MRLPLPCFLPSWQVWGISSPPRGNRAMIEIGASDLPDCISCSPGSCEMGLITVVTTGSLYRLTGFLIVLQALASFKPSQRTHAVRYGCCSAWSCSSSPRKAHSPSSSNSFC